MINGKNTYLSEIIEAIKYYDGVASLREIYTRIGNRNLLPAIQINKNWKDNVRATIQRHCSATKSFNGSQDVFYSVYGLGEGFWGLNSMKETVNLSVNNPIENRIIDEINKSSLITRTEREMLIKARIGQGKFRDDLINKYKHCIVTGIENNTLLIASHIKPWRSSNNQERVSSENGLLLSPLFDRLFDKGFITFSNQGKIFISKYLGEDINRISFDKNKKYLLDLSIELRQNLEYHNDVIFIK